LELIVLDASAGADLLLRTHTGRALRRLIEALSHRSAEVDRLLRSV
jgi:hypothetical protein